ncbi:MAG: MFS transporter [Thermaerobacter sp.]|nr:MFS transporter [Thermaerobacter sp.]
MGMELIEDARFSAFHRKLNILSASGTFLDGYDLAVMGVALPFLVKQFSLGAAMVGILASSVFIGNMLGMMVFGYLTDRIGRRVMYIIDLATFVVFAALTAVSTNIWELMIFRFLLGIGIGADYAISPTLVAEFNPTKKRGGRVAWLSLTFFIGVSASYFIGLLASPLGPEAWRYMLGFGALLAAVVLYFRRQIPESPRWLASQGKLKEAQAVVHDLTGVSAQLTRVESSWKWGELFGKDLIRRTLFVCLFWFAWDVLYYGVTLYSPSILKVASQGSFVDGVLGASSIGLVSILGTIIGMAFLFDRWGRRPSLILGFAGLTAALTALAVMGHPSFFALVFFLNAGVFVGNLGPGVLPFIYASDLFPTNLRAAGTGVGATAGRVGGILGILVFPSLIAAWGIGHAIYLFVGAGLLGLVVSLIMAPETKGQSLEDLEESARAAEKNPITAVP